MLSIRDVWRLEDRHFSAWVAQNIGLLGGAIGIELETVEREGAVGAFSVDIVARDTLRDRVVIIENQLERTDHDHLGKLLTYAAGMKASVVIWISPEFREEHRAAVDWLNENTDETKEFFAIQIEALQIDDSRPAPNFKLVAFPNDWQKATSAQGAQRDDSGRRALFLSYFGELAEMARRAGLRPQRPSGEPYFLLERLPAGAYIATAFSRDQLNVGVYIERNSAAENKRIYDAIALHRSDIEREIGFALRWDFVPGRVRQQVWTSRPIDRNNRDEYEPSWNWVLENAQKLKRVFEPRLYAASFPEDESANA